MRKTLSVFLLALFAVCAFSLFGLPAYGQGRDRDQNKDQNQGQEIEHPNGIVQDWSRHHVVYPRIGSVRSLIAVQHDPRAILSWQAAEREDWHRANRFQPHGKPSGFHPDWSISLGAGGTAPAMYPAKYTFDVNATPSCATDFIVYPVNVTGSATQPNIVAFNNLYSGTAGGTGICNRAVTANDDGVSATTIWSYNIHAAGGMVATSPVLSLDGTKIAFVETGAASTAHFHVLAPKSGDGVATNLQTVTSPVTISSGFATNAPVAGSGTVTDLTLGSTSDTLSSPFVDYVNDAAYIGNDAGVLFRVINVFCTTTTCTGGGTPTPSLDATWGTAGALTIGGTCTGAAGKLTGVVVDGGTGNIFVGCADGMLYGFTSSGVALTPLTVGDGSATGGIVDPPIVDGVNGFVYAVSGSSSGGTSVLVQAKTADLSSPVIATLGAGGQFKLHAPAFNDAYFSNITPGNWMIYDWAVDTSNLITFYGVGFGTGHIMTTGPAANSFHVGSSTPNEFSPVTEFLNGSTDQIFVSGITTATCNFIEYNINSFPTAFPPCVPPGSNSVGATTSAESGGTSGIVVDNASTSAQASSVYFSSLSANNAVKLTQSGLN